MFLKSPGGMNLKNDSLAIYGMCIVGPFLILQAILQEPKALPSIASFIGMIIVYVLSKRMERKGVISTPRQEVRTKMSRQFKLKLGIALGLLGLALPIISLSSVNPYQARAFGLLWSILQDKAIFVMAVVCFFVGLGLVLFAVAEKNQR